MLTVYLSPFSSQEFLVLNWLTLEGWKAELTLELPSSFKPAGFLIQESGVQNYWVAPRSIQSFILLRSINWVPGTPGNWMVKSKLSPHSNSVALRQLHPTHKKGTIKFFFFWTNKSFCFILMQRKHIEAKSCLFLRTWNFFFHALSVCTSVRV